MYQWNEQAEALLQERFGKDSITSGVLMAHGKQYIL